MKSREQKRHEEHGQKLRIDAFAYLLFGHADFLHDFKPGSVFVALGYLFVVNYKDRGKNKFQTQSNSQKQKGTEQVEEVFTVCLTAFYAVSQKRAFTVYFYLSDSFVQVGGQRDRNKR